MFYSIFTGNNISRILAWCIGIFGLIGNSYIIILIVKSKFKLFQNHGFTISNRYAASRRSTSIIRILIFNLASTDLMGNIYCLSLAIADVVYGISYPQLYQANPPPINQTNIWTINPACFMARFYHFTSSQLSICITLIIAIDRFTRVLFPYSQHRLTRFKTYIVMIGCWIFFGSIGIYVVIKSIIAIPKYAQRFSFASNLCLYQDYDSQSLTTFILIRLAIFLFGCLLTISFYISIVIYIQWYKNHTRFHFDRVEKHVLVLVMTISISNILSILPELILFVIQITNGAILRNPLYQLFATTAIIFTFSNTAINPIIYIYFSSSANIFQYICCKSIFKKNIIRPS